MAELKNIHLTEGARGMMEKKINNYCIPISKKSKGKSNGDLCYISVLKFSGQENSTQLYHQVVAMHCSSLIYRPHQCGITTPIRMAA